MDESELEAQALHDTRQRIRDEHARYRKALAEIADHCYCDLHKRLAREALAEVEK